MKTAIRLAEKGLVPEVLLRRGIRSLLRQRLRELELDAGRDPEAALRSWVEHMRGSPIAPVPDQANEQHYEVPAAFFQLVLGARLKYSSGYFDDPRTSLSDAEDAMLTLTAQRARLEDGQDVLELGCGWGSLCLWVAEHHPRSRIVAVSNSASQRAHIESKARRRGLSNLSVLTRDMNDFTIEGRFDRIVSVEMFEHIRNWEKLLQRAASWLKPEGRVFLHVFAHERFAYPFDARDDSDWMSRHFFSGGMMPCPDLIERLESPFEVENTWRVSGTHYSRTAECWLDNLHGQRAAVLDVFERAYGSDQAALWYQRWRLFFLACAELFGYRDGDEWIVSHHLLRAKSSVVPASNRRGLS